MVYRSPDPRRKQDNLKRNQNIAWEKAYYKAEKIPRKILKNYGRLEVAEGEETK